MSGQPPQWQAASQPPGQTAPGLGQVDTDLQLINQTLNRLTAALTAFLSATVVSRVTLSEIAAPAAPANGAILYVDSTTHLLMAVDSVGHRVALT